MSARRRWASRGLVRWAPFAALVVGAAATVALVASRAPVTAATDYLDSELRARVETLQADVESWRAARLAEQTLVPALEVDLLDRHLDTLWQWANGYALTGGSIPVDLPLLMARARRRMATLRGELVGIAAERRADLDAVARFVERYTLELALKDRSGDSLGELVLSERGPFRADEMVTLQQSFTVGSVPVVTGGGIAVAVPFMGGSLQAADPTAPDYVTLAVSRPEVRFDRVEPWGARWQSFINREFIAWRLIDGELRSGDMVTVSYGDRSAGSAGMRVQSWSNDRVELPIFVDFFGDGDLVTLPLPSFEVSGREELVYLNAVVPSVLSPEEPFTLAVRFEDASKNLSSSAVPAFRVLRVSSSGGERRRETVRQVPSSAPGTVEVDLPALAEIGVYRFEIETDDGRLRGRSNPMRVERAPTRRVYWGDTHGHTGFAEGQGSPDGYFAFGRDVARLDFLSLSEHDLWMDAAEWRSIVELTERYDEPGRFSTLLGYEWTSNNVRGGHHNVYWPTTRERSKDGTVGSPRATVPTQLFPRLEQLYEGLRAAYDPDEVLVIPHAHQAADWRQSDAGMERLAEITSGHGTFEFFGNKYLQNGYEVGFIGSSDNHVGHPGYSVIRSRQLGGLAAVLAERNDTEVLFEAMKQRHTYATTGERILLDADLDGVSMGERLSDEQLSDRRFGVRVSGTAPIDTVDLIKNGTVMHRKRFLESEISPRMVVQVKLESSTEVFGGHHNPRGARPWSGSIEVEGATLVSFDQPWFANPDTDHVASNGPRVEFDTDTRGRAKALLLRLEGVTPATRIRVDLQAGRERAGSPGPRDRAPAALAAAGVEWSVQELLGGVQEREMRVERSVDRVSAQLVPPDAPLDVELEFRDLSSGARSENGDYYYVRVTQVDGAMAWSSPWWTPVR